LSSSSFAHLVVVVVVAVIIITLAIIAVIRNYKNFALNIWEHNLMMVAWGKVNVNVLGKL